MKNSTWWVRNNNKRLRREFAAAGLDLSPVWSPTPEDLELENRQLQQLLEWVEAYRTCPDRCGLEKRGWLYPPIDPDIDPETDWLRFEKWMRREPLQWNFVKEFGALRDAGLMSDSEIAAELERVLGRLAQRGVAVDVSEGVPLRRMYVWLCQELRTSDFEIVAPGTTCHIGCSSFCPDCFQRPWCEVGRELVWPEDDECANKAPGHRG